jgi:L-ribulose-5-phosphate 4-epimerase
MNADLLSEEVLSANLDLVSHNLVVFTWGNASAIDRERGWVAIKPSGVSYAKMHATDMTVVDLEGNVVWGQYKPSSDTPTHLELYKAFPEAQGIVHTHARYSTVWAQACRDLPVYGTTHADYFHGAVPCTRKLSSAEIRTDYELNTGRVIVECFRERNVDPEAVPGVLVARHAPFTWGRSAAEAVHNAVVMEECAAMAMQTVLLSPEIRPLERELIDKHYFRKHGTKAYYGQPPRQ